MLRRILIILMVSFLGNGCTTDPTKQASSGVVQNQTTLPSLSMGELTHIVRKGDTLYSIARYYGVNVSEIARSNRLAPPHYTIYPGQKLHISVGTTIPSVTTSPSVSEPSPPISQKPTRRVSPDVGRVSQETGTVTPSPDVSKKCYPPVAWQWPAQGNTAKSVAVNGNIGISIFGRAKQPIRAAAGGKVIYSGSGLEGYRNLVIIQHNEAFLSVYANNNNRFVKQGDTVKTGQTVAEMGTNVAKQTVLHFEIRCHGKAIDPIPYLPK